MTEQETLSRWAEPVHLLPGVLNAKAGVAAAVCTSYGWHRPLAERQPAHYVTVVAPSC